MPLGDPLEETVYDQPPVEPAIVHPTSPSPGQSSEAPGAGGTSGADDTAEPLPSFDPRLVEEFEGLLYIGRLASTFTWLGHRFMVRTLTTGELIEVGLAVKKYDGSVGEAKAYQAAVVAASVISVDGRPLPAPIAKDQGEVETRLTYVLANWYPSTIDKVYEQYYELELKVREVIEAMGKAAG